MNLEQIKPGVLIQRKSMPGTVVIVLNSNSTFVTARCIQTDYTWTRFKTVGYESSWFIEPELYELVNNKKDHLPEWL